MAELVFFTGTMDCGKSTLALQTDHNHAARGREGIVFTAHDRLGVRTLSSRLGLSVPAVEVGPGLSFWSHVVAELTAGRRVDYLICDEAQFYDPEQIDDLARIVDDLGIDVFVFGITTDFRRRLFPGSARLVELADRVQSLQVEALCWCGARATHNARTVDGRMVVSGEQMVVGDVQSGADAGAEGEGRQGAPGGAVVAYEVLCRRHHRRRTTAAAAQAEHMSTDPLPFGDAD